MWQTLIGSFLGAMTPFLLWWITEKYRQKKNYKDNLYFLEKILVDQINDTIEMKKTILDFIDKRLNELVKHIKNNAPDAFSIDSAYFPLFPVLPLSEQIHTIDTKSGYIENKLAKTFQLSRNMPHIIEDIKRQFENTIELNKNLALAQANPPHIQKQNYLDNINRYIAMIKRDMLDTNIPIYLKSLIQTREALNGLRRLGLIKWRIKFDPKYQFHINKKEYQQAKEATFKKIEEYFNKKVEDRIIEVQNL